MKQIIITTLLALVAQAGQGQTISELPNRVLNYQTDISTLLPNPSIRKGTDAIRILEDLQRRYQGKVLLINFWATWGRGSVMALNAMEPLKDTTLNHPDLAFVYLTDETSPFEHWQDKRKHIRGEHFRISTEQMKVLKDYFHIEVLPTYILMDSKGRFRQLTEAYVVDELLKELKSK